MPFRVFNLAEAAEYLQLAEEAVEELAGEVPAADHPDVTVSRRLPDGGQGIGDGPGHEADVRPLGGGEVAGGEDERGAVTVELGPLLGVGQDVGLAEHPFVGGGPLHQHGGARREEPLVGMLTAVDGEQPRQRVVLVGDESVEGGGGVEHDATHAWEPNRGAAG